MKKFLVPILMALILIAGGGGYYIGLSKGKTDLQNELSTKEETYKKSSEAAKDTVNRIMTDLKFSDKSNLYDMTCSEFIKVSKEEFMKNSSTNLFGANSVDTIEISDTNIVGNSADVHVSLGLKNPLLSQSVIKNWTVSLKLNNGNWCWDVQKTSQTSQ